MCYLVCTIATPILVMFAPTSTWNAFNAFIIDAYLCKKHSELNK